MTRANDETGGPLTGKTTVAQEVVVPTNMFTVLRRELEKEAGTLPAVRALHHAGYEAGTSAADTFRAGADGDGVPGLAVGSFWERIERFFGRRGWGTLKHEDAHPGVGVLRSPDWVEAQDERDGSRGELLVQHGISGRVPLRARGQARGGARGDLPHPRRRRLSLRVRLRDRHP